MSKYIRVPLTEAMEKILIQAQAEQIADTTKYMAGKYGIRGDADEQEETARYDLG